MARTLSWERGDEARFGSPKSGKARSISLTPRTVEALRHHRTRQAARRLAAPAWVDGSDLVFTDPVGGPLRRDTVYRRHFAPLLAEAGLPKDTRIHTLRHTTATTLLAQGVDVISVQRLLGHSSAAMTLDVYGHFIPSMGEATAAAMEAALG